MFYEDFLLKKLDDFGILHEFLCDMLSWQNDWPEKLISKYQSFFFFKGKSMYIFFSGETQSQKVMIVNREEVNARCLQVVDFIHFSGVWNCL